jgi:putative radical SAM enzyme (TIGR03279 family)
MNGNGVRSGERFLLRNRPLIITNVEKGGIGDTMGIRPGDHLLEINGHTVRDCIDVQFYSADEHITCIFRREDQKVKIRFRREEGRFLGIDFEPMHFKGCGNRCVFCFIDQNPAGLRSSLYFKDEDYRLSFLHGNYVTLTRVTREDLERIVEQRLSPLYISVHAVDPEIRKRLLGLKRDDRLMEKIGYLIEHGIELHGQIVLCPQWNDGEVLLETLNRLSPFFPQFRSLALVPVGLTDHREGLAALNGYDSRTAEELIECMTGVQKKYVRELGEPFVYMADEFYLLAERPLPVEAHYGEFWQLENGVGMTRLFVNEYKNLSGRRPAASGSPGKIVIVTGVLAEPVLNQYVIPGLRRIRNKQVTLCTVHNRFFGESVTVTGLLTAGDILESLQNVHEDSVIFLPSNCLNADSLFLDDWTIETFRDKLDRSVVVSDNFSELWDIK